MRTRIGSVKSTQKITKALQMVAAAKLRRAQQAAEAARPYAQRHGRGDRQPRGRRLGSVRAAAAGGHRLGQAPSGHRGDRRPRPGGRLQFSIVRAAREKIAALIAAGQGRQDHHHRPQGAATSCAASIGNRFIESYEVGPESPRPCRWCSPSPQQVLELYTSGEFDVVTLIYSRFKSVVTQVPTVKQLIPAEVETAGETRARVL